MSEKNNTGAIISLGANFSVLNKYISNIVLDIHVDMKI